MIDASECRERTVGAPAPAELYKRDLKKLEFHLLDAGHFALETNGDEIVRLMRDFLGRHLAALRLREVSHAGDSQYRGVERT
jgi:hypothetical protein